jgi:probable HAF family extracellular repeat protein
MAFLLLPVATAAAQSAAGVTATVEPRGPAHGISTYTVLPMQYLSEENLFATVFDLRNGFTPGDPAAHAVAAGGSFGPFQPFGELLASFNQAVTYDGGGAISDISGMLVSEAHGLNSNETVVGFASPNGLSDYEAFRYAQGVWTLLPGLGGATTNAMAVNDHEYVVGYDSNGWGHSSAVYWTPDNQLHPLGLEFESSELYAVNNHGVGVGYVVLPSGEFSACTWPLAHGAQPTALPAPFTPNGGCFAQAINDQGDIVGIAASMQGAYQPVLWKNGVATALPIFPNEGTGGARANDINAKGQIVGNSNWGKACLWQDGKIYDLNKLVGSYPLFLTNAVAINDAGVIACQADGGSRIAVLLVPND